MVSEKTRLMETRGRVYVEVASDDDFMERTFGLNRGHTLCAAITLAELLPQKHYEIWVVGGVKNGEYQSEALADLNRLPPLPAHRIQGVYAPEGLEIKPSYLLGCASSGKEVSVIYGPREDRLIIVNPIVDSAIKGQVKTFLQGLKDLPVSFL